MLSQSLSALQFMRRRNNHPNEPMPFEARACKSILEKLIRETVGEMDCGHPVDSGRLLSRGLELFVEAMLARAGAETQRALCNRTDLGSEIVKELPCLDPEHVGGVYEYLLGFNVRFNRKGEPELVPSVKGKRNQGVFYTPQPVVRHIVNSTLAALALSDKSDLLSLRLLDPAVGTGVFLGEALDVISEIVLSNEQPTCRTRVELIAHAFLARAERLGIETGFDPVTSVRVHLVENCLYGVDLDPCAVAIARAMLLKRAFGEIDVFPDVGLHLRVGNALMGSIYDKGSSQTGESLDEQHARAYFGGKLPDQQGIALWAADKEIFHWGLEFPEVFSGGSGGFDAVVGNPPYEIVSVRESGIEERHREQAYFRKMFRSCKGKLNTYRLMLERGLDLLRDKAALGFIMPATLLSDSTAERLRDMVLDESEVLEAVVIPEKARIFRRVTQALLILVLRKGSRTDFIRPVFWNGKGKVPATGGANITRELIKKTGSRIALVRDEKEMQLLEAMSVHPPFCGGQGVLPVASVHQGEVNLTVDREFITYDQTNIPLIRGEHIMALRLVHPAPGRKRLDWVLPALLQSPVASDRNQGSLFPRRGIGPEQRGRNRPWERCRIVVGRVVNMATARRLKAAVAPPGHMLGDMTNSVDHVRVPVNYLLGLLNSRALNWRIKTTSSNNYISAKEIESLPIPRSDCTGGPPAWNEILGVDLMLLENKEHASIEEALKSIRSVTAQLGEELRAGCLAALVERVVERITARPASRDPMHEQGLLNLMDAAVLMLYEADKFCRLLDR